MKAILLCEHERDTWRVYAKEILACLKEEVGLDAVRHTKEMVLSSPDDYSQVQYIFSTWGMPAFTEEEIKRCFPKLEAVFYAAGTVQAFARPFLNCGVKVFSAWAANAVPVAEYTVAQIILANKGFFRTSRLYKTHMHGEARRVYDVYRGNYGANIGIIGAGMIGKLVIGMLKAYKLNVLVFDPFLPDEKATELGVKKVSLEELFTSCNVVSNHLANNQQTRGMITGKLLASMLPDAVFLNTGRGAQVEERELAKVLKERPDLTAILDVTQREPIEEDHPFYELDNCVLTPHIAGSNGDEVVRMAEYMVEEYKALISKLPCRYEVTHKMLETMA